MTPEEQLDYWRAHKEIAWSRVLSMIGRQKDIILALAEERLIAGFKTHDDTSWHRPPQDLRLEVLEELADAPVWECIGMYAEEHHPYGRVRSTYVIQTIPDSPDD